IGKFLQAIAAPGIPEMKQHHPALQLAHVKRGAIHRDALERNWFADAIEAPEDPARRNFIFLSRRTGENLQRQPPRFLRILRRNRGGWRWRFSPVRRLRNIKFRRAGSSGASIASANQFRSRASRWMAPRLTCAS